MTSAAVGRVRLRAFVVAAVLGAVIVSVVSWLLNTLVSDRAAAGNRGNPAMPGRGGSGAIDLEKKGDRWE